MKTYSRCDPIWRSDDLMLLLLLLRLSSRSVSIFFLFLLKYIFCFCSVVVLAIRKPTVLELKQKQSTYDMAKIEHRKLRIPNTHTQLLIWMRNAYMVKTANVFEHVYWFKIKKSEKEQKQPKQMRNDSGAKEKWKFDVHSVACRCF